MDKKTLRIALVVTVALLIYINRDFINPVKLPLDADAGAKGDTPNVLDPANATGDNSQAINRAMLKLRTGSVDVRKAPKKA